MNIETEYKFGTKPFEHQVRALNKGAGLRSFAYFLEQGLGKTKVALDDAYYCYNQGEVDLLFVIAPNLVHRQWMEAIDQHTPDYIDTSRRYAWTSKTTKAEQKKQYDFKKGSGLAIFTVNIEAIITKKGIAFIKSLLLQFNRIFLIIDESQRIRTPGAKRTRAAMGLAKHARYRRILTGTPIPNGPLNFYSQFRFLDKDIFDGMTYASFKSRYAEWEQRQTKIKGRTINYQFCTGYKNIEELMAKIRPWSVRIKKDECFDIPKIRQTIPFQLPKAHLDLYRQAEEETVVQIGDFYDNIPEFRNDRDKIAWMVENVDKLEASTMKLDSALTRFIRLQQITSGFYVPVDGEPRPIDGKFPKIDALMDVLSNIDSKVIIWSHFTNLEHQPILERLVEEYGQDAVEQYSGRIDSDSKERAKWAFKTGSARILLANQASGGTGLDLPEAEYHIFFSQDMDAEKRSQAEDRSHRIGSSGVVYIDLLAAGTINNSVRRRLFKKMGESDKLLSTI